MTVKGVGDTSHPKKLIYEMEVYRGYSSLKADLAYLQGEQQSQPCQLY